MIISDFLHTLMGELNRLYTQLALAQLHKRMHGYHHHANHDAGTQATDIKSTLSDYIDNVVSKINASGAHQPAAGSKTTSKYAGHHLNDFPFISHPHRDIARPPCQLNKKQISELTKYFKERKKGSDLHPSIKEKLKDSLWEHINAAIQCAHRGDAHNSKMHVDIANYAFKEVAHYMPEEQYAALAKKINERLEALKTAQP